jgi:hypothetical protein
MSEPLYKCFHCLDIGVVVRERFRADGKSLGHFGSPCSMCAVGEKEAIDWKANGLRRAAEQNEIEIRRLDGMLTSDAPEAELQRWRAAARDRQSRREEKLEQARGAQALGTGVTLDSAIRSAGDTTPSSRRTTVRG